MKEYLNDIQFLTALDEMRIKEHFIKLQILNFKEQPIREIQGLATGGSVTVNGASAVRRTISLTMASPNNENDIANIDNIISMNKKVKVEIGIKNLLTTYSHYGDIIWFPLGVYVITEASSSTSANSTTISIKGKDKMCLLDGSCGGVLPSAVTFHEAQVEDENGDVSIEKIPIFTIIKECVRHYGKEIEQNIFINDIDLVAKQAVRYIGQHPIWFTDDYSSFIISENAPSNTDFLAHKFVYGQDIGYMETDFTFPGELVFKAGDAVTAVLDKIVQSIGNYEYFYDLEGHFIFQEKKDYLNHYYTPIIDLGENFYVKAFSDTKYYTVLQNAQDVISYNHSPKYEKLKNDFVVWGSRTDKDGVHKSLKYHLAIDEKPIIDLANTYMWEVYNYKNNKKQHLYYFFEDEEKDYSNIQGPVVIELKVDSTITSQEYVSNFVKNYTRQHYILSNNPEKVFVLYFRVFWLNQIQYYKVNVKNEIISVEHLSQYDDSLAFQGLTIGLCLDYTEEVKKENGNNLLWTDEIDTDMNTENKFNNENSGNSGGSYNNGYIDRPTTLPLGVMASSISSSKMNQTSSSKSPSSWSLKSIITGLFKNATQSNRPTFLPSYDEDIDPEMSYPGGGETGQESSNKPDIKKDYKYTLLSKLDNELGYYKDKEWVTVLELQEDNLTIADLEKLYNKYKTHKNLRIFLPSGSENIPQIITTINNNSGLYRNDINPQGINYPKDVETFNFVYDDFVEIDKFTKDRIKSMYDKCIEKFLENSTGFINDVKTLINLSNDSSSISLLPFDGTISPDMDTENKQTGQSGSSAIGNHKQTAWFTYIDGAQKTNSKATLSKEIYDYYKALKSDNFYNDFFSKMFDYQYNYKVSNLPSKYLIQVLTYTPEYKEDFDFEENFYYELKGKPCYEWREELYRQALLNQDSAGESGYYDEELLAFWRNNFDTLNENWKKEWEDNFENSSWEGWNPAIYKDPGLLSFWLDFIDNSELLNAYSVNQIGRRTQSTEKENIKYLYKLEVPDVIFMENKGEITQALALEYQSTGQQYCALKSSQMKYFTTSGTGSTAFDLIREMLYSYLTYNVSVNINCIAKYYLEPNNIIYISDKVSNIQGDYAITQFTIPLTYNGNMTISTNKAMVRV